MKGIEQEKQRLPKTKLQEIEMQKANTRKQRRILNRKINANTKTN